MLPLSLLLSFTYLFSPVLTADLPPPNSFSHLLFSSPQNNRLSSISPVWGPDSPEQLENPYCPTDPEDGASTGGLNNSQPTLEIRDSLVERVVLNPKAVLNPKNSSPTSTIGLGVITVGNPKGTTTTQATTKTSSTSTKITALSLPTPPSSTCTKQYTNTAGGAVYGPGLGSFSMSPRPSSFVKRSGAKLTLDGNLYRMVGPNIYWLGLDENVDSTISYPDKGRIREAMAITVAMGGNTIRSHTLGISTGNSFSVWPRAGVTNLKAFDTIDYAIYAARNYGLRVIIPLTDNYAYYHGGKYDFIGWAGLSQNDPDLFYTNNAVITLYKQYISVILSHVNTYTGVALGSDPTIIAWETGNELGGYLLGGGAPPASWTKIIAQHIKGMAPNHLVIDGADGLVDASGTLRNTGFGVTAVDLVSDHFYPAADWLLQKDIGLLGANTVKSFFVGELDWTGLYGGDALASFYSIVEAMPGSGSFMWSLFGHDGECCDFISHADGYSLLYPNGNTNALQAQALVIMKHWYRMRGLTPPSALPAVACPQPELLP